MNIWDSDVIVQQWLQANDDTAMPMPAMESEPHLLISQVRKHYMAYLIKLLAVNYENSQKLLNKNIYLPSAIWRCAKSLEMSAAKSCMVVQLYRQNIITAITELKEVTKKGKLFKRLYNCLRTKPENEKKVQVDMIDKSECNCHCSCGLKNNKRRPSVQHLPPDKIPKTDKDYLNISVSDSTQSIDVSKCSMVTQDTQLNMDKELEKGDDIMRQLAELFQDVPDDDDIFEGALDTTSTPVNNSASTIAKETNQTSNTVDPNLILEAELNGMMINNLATDTKTDKSDKTKHHEKRNTKWLCEEYFLKVKLYEKLDELRENRSKFVQIKMKMIELFGYDSDDEGIVSPIDETPEFTASCKERIAPWVVKLLNPYYANGRIRGKPLFKSLARHLIQLIYQCSKFPYEYEVQSFVQDFLESHKTIRCEADFEGFRIENF